MNMIRIGDLRRLSSFTGSVAKQLGTPPQGPPSIVDLRAAAQNPTIPKEMRNAIFEEIDRCEVLQNALSLRVQPAVPQGSAIEIDSETLEIGTALRECLWEADGLIGAVIKIAVPSRVTLSVPEMRIVAQHLSISDGLRSRLLGDIEECGRLHESLTELQAPPVVQVEPGATPLPAPVPLEVSPEILEARKAVGLCRQEISAELGSLLKGAGPDQSGVGPVAEPAVATGTLVAAGGVAALLLALAV